MSKSSSVGFEISSKAFSAASSLLSCIATGADDCAEVHQPVYKGIDYAGDLRQFETDFAEDLSVIAFAVSEFQLPKTLKLSVHSGSDKFSLYPILNRLIKARGAGLHLKTAGTTWLGEVCGLAESGAAVIGTWRLQGTGSGGVRGEM